jgi:hypothetical protein
VLEPELRNAAHICGGSRAWTERFQRFFSGRCQHRGCLMKSTPVDTKQRLAENASGEVTKVIVFASWGS